MTRNVAPVSASTDHAKVLVFVFCPNSIWTQTTADLLRQQGVVRRGSGWIVRRCRGDLHRKGRARFEAGRHLSLYILTIYLCLNHKPRLCVLRHLQLDGLHSRLRRDGCHPIADTRGSR